MPLVERDGTFVSATDLTGDRRIVARGPVSRVLSCERYVKHQPRMGSHSSRPRIAPRLEQPTRATGSKRPAIPA